MLTYPDQTAVSTRALAWNAVGDFTNENVVDQPMTAAELIAAAGLADWNVRHVPLTAGFGDHATAVEDAGTMFPDQRGVIATIKGKPTPLGVVGGKHHVVQNEDTVDLLDTMVEDSGSNYVAGGTLRSGRGTFVIMKMPHGVQIGGVDAHEQYMGVTNHHDGKGALTAWTTLVRLRCTNMLNSSIRGAASSWRLRHTSSIGGRVQEAREALRLTTHWQREFEALAERLMATPMSGDEFDRFIDQIAKPSTSDKAGWIARAEEKRGTLRYLYHEAPTQEVGRGTRWAAYNAATEYADHFLPIRSANPRARGERILADTTVTNFKQDALDLLLVPA